MTLEPWDVLDDQVVFEAERWFRVRRQRVRARGGRDTHDYYMIEKGDFATVAAFTGSGELLVARQYRHGVPGVSLDLPSGYVEAGEDPETAMRRELLEETGHEAATWTPLGTFTVDANRGAGRAHLFLATGARRVAEPRMDGELEDIEVLTMTTEEAARALAEGLFRTLAPVACLALAMRPAQKRA